MKLPSYLTVYAIQIDRGRLLVCFQILQHGLNVLQMLWRIVIVVRVISSDLRDKLLTKGKQTIARMSRLGSYGKSRARSHRRA